MKYPSPRKTVHYPRSSKLDEYLEKKTKEIPNTPLWVHLEKIIEKLPCSGEQQAMAAYTDFIKTVCLLFPERKNEIFRDLEKLRPLIFKNILKIKNDGTLRESLPDSYFDELKKM